jgi:hypothetical protein
MDSIFAIQQSYLVGGSTKRLYKAALKSASKKQLQKRPR